MSHVEPPFIIAVIREKEKSLLGDNEITRIMHAESLADARAVLMSTPYGLFLADGAPIAEAVYRALEAEFLWLKELVANPKVLAFLAARYDILHLAQAIMALVSGAGRAPDISRIGTVSHELLQSMVFTEEYTATKSTHFFVDLVQAQKDAIAQGLWSMPWLFTTMQQALEARLKQLAFTPLMRELAEHVKLHHDSDLALRTKAIAADATAYELAWDVQAIDLARTVRFEPIGYDPIIAYWISKEMEAKTIKLLSAALAGGFSQAESATLVRPLAHV